MYFNKVLVNLFSFLKPSEIYQDSNLILVWSQLSRASILVEDDLNKVILIGNVNDFLNFWTFNTKI